MWQFIAKVILRNRIVILVSIGLLAIFMGYKASFLQMEYAQATMLPENDSVSVVYQKFKEKFGSDRGIMIVAVKDSSFFELNKVRAWMQIRDSIAHLPGIASVMTVSNLQNIFKDTLTNSFMLKPLLSHQPNSQAEVDSLKAVVEGLPFYEGRLFNSEAHLYLMGVLIENDVLQSKTREDLVGEIVKLTKEKMAPFNSELHFSGLPYIQTVTAQMVRHEVMLFMLLATLITLGIMYFFFRSGKAIFFASIVVTVGVLCAFGFMVLMGYKMTILTGVIPPLLIVIGIPNSVFLLNKYHTEYLTHGDKRTALIVVIQKIGKATLLTNLTTAAGFVTFIFTESHILKQFGIVATVNIIGMFLWSLMLIPILFSLYPPPSVKNVKHLERKSIRRGVEWLVNIVLNYRNWVYVGTGLIIVLGIYGTTLIQREGKIVNDIPHDHDLFTSLMLMENDMGGVMPLEILVDTRQPRKAKSFGTIRKLSQLSDSLRRFPELAKPMSIADAAHFAKQGFYNGDKEYYGMPSMQEMSFISKYLPKESNASKDLMGKYIDSTQQITRMSIQMKDVGAIRMHTLADSIWTVIREVFPAEKYDITLTGFTMLYARGADYLVQSMFVSLALAIVLIAGLMAMMFSEWRMVLISLIPNVIPLLMTGALMGFFHVPIKPSTVLVFSIAFGISVDNTIHFLAKYRQELLVYNGAIRQSVISAIRETGVSMLYTSIILFSGFSVFAISDFGGTIALGLLVSFTLFSALFSNLLILPSLLLTLEKIITTKAFSENN